MQNCRGLCPCGAFSPGEKSRCLNFVTSRDLYQVPSLKLASFDQIQNSFATVPPILHEARRRKLNTEDQVIAYFDWNHSSSRLELELVEDPERVLVLKLSRLEVNIPSKVALALFFHHSKQTGELLDQMLLQLHLFLARMKRAAAVKGEKQKISTSTCS